MEEVTKETVTTAQGSNQPTVVKPTKFEASNSQTTEYLIYFIFGALEILLAFRLVLKLMGASSASGFVAFIYGMTSIFVLPFEGIFHRGVAEGIETTAVFEPSTLVALIVYAILAWGVVWLVRILSREKQPA